MRIPIGVRKSVAVLAAAAGVFAIFFAAERPWFLSWGATPAEVAAARPGDERVPAASDRTTRAVTIAAPPEVVWPWLAQIGQDRGGFYSYELLENLVGCEMPRASRVMPEHQAWNPGDRLWMYPPEKLDGVGGARLVAYEPGRHLVFATRQIGSSRLEPEYGVWGFAIRAIDARTTRLIAWGRGAGEKHPFGAAFNRAVFEPVHYVMERRMMLNIKALAEGRIPSQQDENATVLLWTLTVVVIVAALIQVARRRTGWAYPLAIAALAALAFQFLTLLQPPVELGTVVVLVLATALMRGGPSSWPVARKRPIEWIGAREQHASAHGNPPGPWQAMPRRPEDQ